MKPNRRKLLLILSIGIAFLFPFMHAKAQICSINAGIDKTICITQQPLVLSGSAGTSQVSPPEYLWTKLAGPPATIITPASLTTNVTGLTPGNYVFQLSNKCIDGLYAKDIVSVTVLPEPPTAVVGNDMMICSNRPVQLSANAVSGINTGTWTVIPAGGTFSPNANDPNAIYTGPTRVGTRRFTWTISNGACQKSDVMLVTFLETAMPVSAGPDTVLVCKGKCVVLNGSYQGYIPQHGLWSVVSGPNIPTFSDPADHSAKVCNLVPGIYRFRWTVTGPCVNDSDDVVINVVNINVPPPSLGDQVYTNFCESPAVSSEVLTGAPLAPGDTAIWIQTGGGTVATFSPDNHHATVTVANLTGTFPYKFTYTHTSSSGCTIVTTHTVYRSQPITGLTDPADQELPCDVTATSFNISYNRLSTISNSITRRVVFVSGPFDSGRVELGNSITTGTIRTDTWSVDNLVLQGTYIYRLEYSNACGTSYQDIAITVSRTPGTVNAGSDIILPCHGLSITPIGSVNAPGIYTWAQINGPSPAIITNPQTLTPGLTGLIQGVYTIRLTNWGGNTCPVKTGDMTVTVTQLPPLVATAGTDTTVCGGNYHLLANTPGITETGTWSVSPADAISFYPDEHAPNAYANGLEANSSYTFTWTVSNVCGSLSAIQHINTGPLFSPPVPDAGENICAAQGTTIINLSGNDPSGANILWTALTPGTIISSPNTQNTETTLTNGSGVYLFEYALGTSGCEVFRDTVAVTVKSNVQVNAGPDINICTGSFPYTVNVNGSITSRSNNLPVVWIQLSGPSAAVIVSPDDSQTDIENLQEGIYQFEFKTLPSNECEHNADTMSMTILREPSDAIAGPDQSICNATIRTIVNLAANTPVTGTGHWQLISSPPGSNSPVFSNPASPVSTITNLSNGTYRLRWIITNGNQCAPKTDDININVSAIAAVGNDISSCNANTVQLTGNANTTGMWTMLSGLPGVTVTANSGNTAIVTGLVVSTVPMQYTFRYSLPDAGACRGSYDDVILTNYPLPSQANTGGNKIICFDEASVTLSGNMPVSGRGSWLWQSGPNNPVAGLANNMSNDTILNNLIPGIYTYQYRISTNAVCPSFTDNMQVIKLSKANAQSDIRLCNASSANLNASVPSIGRGTWSYISGPASSSIAFAGIHNPGSIVSGLVPGVYIFRWTIDSVGNCRQNYDDIQVTIDPPVTALNAGNNRSFCQGGENAFSIGSAGLAGISYNWSPTAMLSNPNIAQPVFLGINNPGNYVYTVRASIGTCEAYSSVSIAVKPIPFANIEVLNASCIGQFIASNPGNGVSNPVFDWSFGYGTDPSVASGIGPHLVTFNNRGPRNITLNVSSADGCSNNSAIQFLPYCVLPVKLVSFDAVWKTNYADVQWMIEEDFNEGHFELERSFDGTVFSFVKQIENKPGIKKYEYADINLPLYQSEIFYRLKLVDRDHHFTYSAVRKIKLQLETPGVITVWPNPFSNKLFISYKTGRLPSTLVYKIYNSVGQLMLERPVDPALSNGSIEIKNLDVLSPGFYNLRLISGNKIISNHKIIKNNL